MKLGCLFRVFTILYVYWGRGYRVVLGVCLFVLVVILVIEKEMMFNKDFVDNVGVLKEY